MSAPDRIYIDRGPKGGWMHRDKRMPDTVAEYVRLDPNTRVVPVEQLQRWSFVIEATESCLKTWNGTGSFMNVDLALSQIRAIIEGKDQ